MGDNFDDDFDSVEFFLGEQGVAAAKAYLERTTTEERAVHLRRAKAFLRDQLGAGSEAFEQARELVVTCQSVKAFIDTFVSGRSVGKTDQFSEAANTALGALYFLEYRYEVERPKGEHKVGLDQEQEIEDWNEMWWES